MYKYLSITANFNEMMVMMKSLPTNTVIFDRNGNIVDSNQSALDFLHVNTVDDYRIKRWGFLNNHSSLKKIVQELSLGRIIRNVSVELMTPEGKSIAVNFSACMLSGIRKVYIFQFFELPIYSNRHLNKKRNSIDLYDVNIINVNEVKSVSRMKIFADNAVRKSPHERFIDQSVVQQIVKQYPILLSSEAIICSLIVLGFSIKEISRIRCKLVANTYTSINKIVVKLQLKTREELFEKLTTEHTYSSVELELKSKYKCLV
jgi:hypothetical protein